MEQMDKRSKETSNGTDITKSVTYYDSIYRFILKSTQDPWVAKDLTQEVYLKAFKYSHTYKESGNLRGWMFTIAKNLLADYYRIGRNGFVTDKGPETFTRDTLDFKPYPYEPSFESKMLGEEVGQEVTRIENKFRGKRCLNWRDMYDLTIEDHTRREVSELLSIPMGSVESGMFRMRKYLRKTMLEEIYN